MPARRIRTSLASATTPPDLHDDQDQLDRRRFLERSAVVGAGLLAATTIGVEPAFAGTPAHFGAGCEPRGRQRDQRQAVLALEHQLGRRLGIMRRYAFWDSKVPDSTHAWAAHHGRIPYIAWHAYARGGATVPWGEIARGDHDGHLRATARNLRNLGDKVYFCFHHEPENDPWNGGPAEFRAAWNHVRKVFDDVGTNNLTWVVSLMASTYNGGHGGAAIWLPKRFDLIGADGYNRFACSADPWKSFAEIFKGARSWAQRQGTGLFVGEYGCVEKSACGGGGATAAKADWFRHAARVGGSWRELRAVVYSHGKSGQGIPYWADSSGSSIRAFRSMAHRPRFAN